MIYSGYNITSFWCEVFTIVSVARFIQMRQWAKVSCNALNYLEIFYQVFKLHPGVSTRSEELPH